MKIKRRGRYLLWQVNGQAIGDVYLSDDELRLTQRLWLINFGKGTGAIFQNIVVRSQNLEVDASWPEVGSEESME